MRIYTKSTKSLLELCILELWKNLLIDTEDSARGSRGGRLKCINHRLLKWLKSRKRSWRQLIYFVKFFKRVIHFFWWTFSEMLTLFLARKKMAIWENGAFSAVREGEIQFQNMVRSMIFSSCRFFEFLYILFLTFVIKFFDARVKVQPISISY